MSFMKDSWESKNSRNSTVVTSIIQMRNITLEGINLLTFIKVARISTGFKRRCSYLAK